jgi:sarcosine oxidase subunit beta
VSPIDRCDVAIVGGGIVGTALAYYLVENGVPDVVLVEQSLLGSGTTGGSAGGVRQQFGTELEIEMSRRGLAFWKSAEQRFDSPCPFHEDGYLLLTGQASIAAEFEAAAELQRRAGLTGVELVQPARLSEIVPWLSSEGLLVGSWSPGDGHMVPTDGVAALARAARTLGVQIREGWPVNRIERLHDGWQLVGPEPLWAGKVVVAAGYWTPELIRPLGHEIDIRLNVQYQLISEPAFPGERVPITIDVDSGLFVEREGQGLALAVIGRTPQLASHQEVMYEFIRRARIRAPGLLNLKVAKEVTLKPATGGDGSPYVGELEPGLWTCCFVGHGAMHGPPIAELVAKELAGRPDRSVDMQSWRPDRQMAGKNSVWWRRPQPEYVSRALAEVS